MPILDLLFDDFMRQKGDKTTERYEKWLFKTLLHLKRDIKNDRGLIFELGKQWIKPLCEFTQFHTFRAKYPNAKFDYTKFVIITVDGDIKLAPWDPKERDVKVPRWSKLFVTRFYK
jgi:hypothetical protein